MIQSSRLALRAVVSGLLLTSLCVPVLGAEQGSPDETFSVFEYRVLGNTTLAARDIEASLYPQLGEHKSIADVEAVRQTLEKLYRDRGYGTIYVDIPEQTIDGGIVRLRVTEGRLDRVRISGARYFANGAIRDMLPALQSGTVVPLAVLQEQLTRVNQQSADRQVTPVLRAGKESGLVDVELRVKDTLPLHASVEVNDRYTANTSRTRLNVNAGYDNLFLRFHRLSFQYQTAPESPDETRVLAATYIAPAGSEGNLLAAYAVDTNSDFAAIGDAGAFGVLGAGRIYGARYIVRLPATGAFSQNATFGADYKDFADNIKLAGGVTDTTPIRYLLWSLGYQGNAGGMSGSTGFNVTASFGMRGVVNEPAAFEFKRYKAQPNFFYVRADATHDHALWGGSSLAARVAGQWTGSPVVSNEQFAMGGAESIRGYLESAQLGDLGLSGGLELRSPSFHQWFGGAVDRLVAVVFADAGIVSILEPLPDQNDVLTRSVSLSSWGAGLRLAGPGGLNATVDWAYPLQSSSATLKGDSRLHFQVRYGF